MGKITRFEDLICWQKARGLVSRIYSVTNTGSLSQDYGLKDQLRRSAVSIMTNIAEGFTRFHRKEFIRFLDFAQSSAAEVKSLLYLILDLKYLVNDIILSLQDDAEETKALTLGLLKYVDKSISNNKVSEPISEYSPVYNTLKIPAEFINLETPTHKHPNT